MTCEADIRQAAMVNARTSLHRLLMAVILRINAPTTDVSIGKMSSVYCVHHGRPPPRRYPSQENYAFRFQLACWNASSRSVFGNSRPECQARFGHRASNPKAVLVFSATVCLTCSGGSLICYKVARQFQSHPLRQPVRFEAFSRWRRWRRAPRSSSIIRLPRTAR
jgi:hypothetical protein